MQERVLALGSTAGLMPQLSREIRQLWVMANKASDVDPSNPKVIFKPEFSFPMSRAAVGNLRALSSSFAFFHCELGYAATCLMAGKPYGAQLLGASDRLALFSSGRSRLVFRSAFREALRQAEYVIADPNSEEGQAAARLRSDVRFIGIPVDQRVFSPSLRKPWPSEPGGRLTLFSPCRIRSIKTREGLSSEKGHEIMWQALKLMKNRGRVTVIQPRWGLGKGWDVIAAKAPKEVRFVNRVPRNLMPSRYAAADLVLGQLNAAGVYGTTEIEATLSGLPVATYVPRTPTGEASPFLPKKRNPDELAALLDRLIDEPAFREEYARRCREYALLNHAISNVSLKYTNLFNSVSGEAPSPSTMAKFMVVPSQIAILTSKLLGMKAVGGH